MTSRSRVTPQRLANYVRKTLARGIRQQRRRYGRDESTVAGLRRLHRHVAGGRRGVRMSAVGVELLAGRDAAEVERDERDQRAGDVVGDVVPAEVRRREHREPHVDPQGHPEERGAHRVLRDQRHQQGDRDVQGREAGDATGPRWRVDRSGRSSAAPVQRVLQDRDPRRRRGPRRARGTRSSGPSSGSCSSSRCRASSTGTGR